ncbi:hypothetical protein VZT92_019187 [Zoarces viviparus]|uniref:Uncharacterized protein n=1 Tax=Zoarces viviparus TaxID=48416 RepID=A0AAW1EJ57_ZOAVI
MLPVMGVCSRAHSHDGERPRGAARADDHHGCLCLQTAVSSVKPVRTLEEVKTVGQTSEYRGAQAPGGHNGLMTGP